MLGVATKPLTDKQLAFCREYVIDFNGAQAAIRAGYSPNGADVTAARMLKDERIQHEISHLTARKAERADIQADEVIGRLSAIARADIRDVIDWGYEEIVDDEGIKRNIPYVKPKNSGDLPPEISVAVAEVSMSKQGTFKVKMHDRSAALEKLMRHLGLYEKDNRQKTDALADLIASAQGTALPVATRSKPAGGGGHE